MCVEMLVVTSDEKRNYFGKNTHLGSNYLFYIFWGVLDLRAMLLGPFMSW